MTSVPSGLPEPRFVRHTRALRQLVDQLRDEPLIAVDTESNSLFAYYEQVCLVQISTRTEDIIVDPLAVDDMGPLGDLLADPDQEVIFHAAEYDVITLKRDFQYHFENIFDTMLAARICGWERVGLGNILEEQFGIRAQKKFQRADWTTRPLPDDQLLYAQMDTHFLPELRDRLLGELKMMGRLEEALETFAELKNLPPAEHTFDPEGYWRIGQTQKLSRRQMGIIRELYLARDALAQRRNTPPFKVFSDRTLVELAELSPRRLDDLYPVRGMNSRTIRWYGDAILEAIQKGRNAPPPTPPRHRRHTSPEVQERYEALHDWRKHRAQERGVESDVIVARETLWALARDCPARLEELEGIPGLGPWRREQYGKELLAILHGNSQG